jgi:acyl-CoA synthetase (AMP-forming)/AMP-acid ligase II
MTGMAISILFSFWATGKMTKPVDAKFTPEIGAVLAMSPFKIKRAIFGTKGRTDDMFKAAGYRIGPGEIENCLVKHPAVVNAAVVAKARC